MHKHKLLLLSGGVLLVSFLVFCVTNLNTTKISADSSSSWLANAEPILQKDSELAPGTPVPYSINDNRDCTQQTLTLANNIKHDTCLVKTSFGLLDSNGNLQLNNTKLIGQLYNYTGYLQGVIGIPESSTIINYTSAPVNGLYLWFTKNLPSSINTTVDPLTFMLNYQVKRDADVALRDGANNMLAAQTDSLSFSSNGKWMIVDSPHRAMLRVNLETLDVLPFAPPFNYDTGIAPGAQTAISSDGRYAVVASRPFNTFKIYDLSTCSAVPATISSQVNCQSRDLLPFMQSKVTNFQGVGSIRFLSDETLSFYANYYLTTGVPSTNRVAKYVLSSAGNLTQRIEYIALGDSYISGEGAYDYQYGTDTETNHCHISQKSYPYLMASNLNMNSFHSIACSGAIMEDITNSNIPDEKSKSQAKDRQDISYNSEIYSNFLPGYRAQINFVNQYSPGIVTISISGNDVGFSDILKTCISADFTCYNNYEDRLELVRQINAKFPEIVDTYQKIKNASPDSKVYAIGYPQVAYFGGNCANNVHLNQDEINFSNLLISYLDQILQLAASKAGVLYVDTQDALEGHRLCETKASNVAVNGLTTGNDSISLIHGPFGNESYHPNKLGHELLEKKILAATNNLTVSMPTADNNAAPPPEDNLGILDAPKANRGIYNLYANEQMTDDTMYQDSLEHIYISGLEYSLKPQSSYSLTIHSDTINIGSFNSDSNGDLSFIFQVPQTVPVGFHSIQITGTNLVGEQVEIYKTVYIGATQNDFDGNGVDNSQDPCGFIGSSGQDYDQDGVDDSCDGFIAEPPVVSDNKTQSVNVLGALIITTNNQPTDSQILLSNPSSQTAMNNRNQPNPTTQQTRSTSQHTSPQPVSDTNTNIRYSTLAVGSVFGTLALFLGLAWKFID